MAFNDIREAPTAWLLTAGELRRALADAPEHAHVAIAIPAGTPRDSDGATYFALRVARSHESTVVLEAVVLDELTRTLFEAVRGGYLDDVTRALDRGADVRSRDPGFCQDAEPLLVAAVIRGHAAIVALLLSRGADVDARTSSGGTALMRACNGGDLACAKLLLDAGADPDLRNEEGYSAGDRIPGNVPALIELLASRVRPS